MTDDQFAQLISVLQKIETALTFEMTIKIRREYGLDENGEAALQKLAITQGAPVVKVAP